MKCNAKLRPDYFSVNVFVLAIAFRQQISNNKQFFLKLSAFLISPQNTTASVETFTEK